MPPPWTRSGRRSAARRGLRAGDPGQRNAIELVATHPARGLLEVALPILRSADVTLQIEAALGQERPQLARLDTERELLVGLRQRREEPLGADKRTRVREHVAMTVGKQQSAPERRAGTPPQRGIDGRFGQVVRDAFPEDERACGVAIAGGG